MVTDGAAVMDGRAGITFGVELYVPWDAPAQIAPLRRADVGYGWQVAGGIPPLAHRRADVGYGWQVAGGIPPLAHRRPTGGKTSIVTPPRRMEGA